MALFLKIIIFILVNLIGFYVMPVQFNLAILWGILPEFPTEEVKHLFTLWWGAGGMVCWFFAMLVSIGYFVSKTKKRFVFLSMPVIGPFLFGIGVLLAF